MRRDSKRDGGGGGSDAGPSGSGAAYARDMIGEIENRSSHLLAVSSLKFAQEISCLYYISFLFYFLLNHQHCRVGKISKPRKGFHF
jgi:hypothetical protein